MAQLVITEFMDQAVVEELAADFPTIYDPGLVNDRARLTGLMAQCQGLIVRNRTRVDAELITASPRLRVIGRLGVGLDNIDQAAAAERSIAVCPATGANAVSVAEYVIATLLQLLRPISAATALMLDGEFPRQQFSAGREISGRVLGLVGGGLIGRAVASRARALGMEILLVDPMLPLGEHPDGEVVRLEECLERADAISLHVPLTPETTGMINADRLSRMKPGAMLINTARGGIVDHTALAAMMRRGHIGGAALDVFEEEPTSAAGLAMFDGLDNVILTPHVAGLTEQSNQRVAEITAAQVRAVLEKA